MSRHHHRASTSLLQRPLSMRLLALLAILLPPLLTTVALAFTLLTILRPTFALSTAYGTSSTVAVGTYMRSPFYHCTTTTSSAGTILTPTNCTRIHGWTPSAKRLCQTSYTSSAGLQICQEVVASASLYLSAAVLVGCGLLFTLLYALLSVKRAWATTWVSPYTAVAQQEGTAERYGQYDDENQYKGNAGASSQAWGQESDPGTTSDGEVGALASPWVSFLGSFTTVVLLMAAACLIMAQILGVDALVFKSDPVVGGQDFDDVQSVWFMGKAAYVYSTTAFVTTAIAGLVMAVGAKGVLD